MFRRSTTTPRPTRPAARSTGAPSATGSTEAVALRARLDRVHRRLAEVGSAQVTGHVHAIDTAAARRDPLTRPFAMPLPVAPADAAGEQVAARRPATAPLPRPA